MLDSSDSEAKFCQPPPELVAILSTAVAAEGRSQIDLGGRDDREELWSNILDRPSSIASITEVDIVVRRRRKRTVKADQLMNLK